jgi:hypothetical protein
MSQRIQDLSVEDLNRLFWSNRYDLVAIRNERRDSGTDIREARSLLLEWQAANRAEARRRISERYRSYGSVLGLIANGWRQSPPGWEG